GRTRDAQDWVVLSDMLTVLGKAFEANCGGTLGEAFHGKRHTGDDQAFTRHHERSCRGLLGYRGLGRHVTGADILGQGGLDGAANFLRGKRFHAVSLRDGRSVMKKNLRLQYKFDLLLNPVGLGQDGPERNTGQRHLVIPFQPLSVAEIFNRFENIEHFGQEF
ncbi:MAG: hypothetical protein QOF48_3840, partial [Verrucomicrobiota bacterium]